MLHRHQLRGLEQRVAAQVLEERRAEQRVGGPEHRGEGHEEHGEAVDHGIRITWTALIRGGAPRFTDARAGRARFELAADGLENRCSVR